MGFEPTTFPLGVRQAMKEAHQVPGGRFYTTVNTIAPNKVGSERSLDVDGGE